MNLQQRMQRLFAVASALARWIAGDVRAHWVSALFSVAVAFGVWLLIEDVTNPRSEARAPANSGITVEAVNIPDGYLPPSLATVQVRVRGRESDLRELRPEDFRATVDLAEYDPTVGALTVPVRVTSRRDGVEVLEVFPSTMRVQLQPAWTALVEVTARVIAAPPSGFRIKQVDNKEVPPAMTPQIVTVIGPRELVERVARVELDVDLSEARTERYAVKGNLVARSAEGNVLQVRLSSTQAEAVFQIESVFSPRTLGIAPQVSGTVAHGYRIRAITVDPPLVRVTGPRAVVDSLTGPLLLDPIDVSNQDRTFTRSRSIEAPANVEIDVENVVVTVEIEPIVAEQTVYRALRIVDLPAGLQVLPESSLTTAITLRGNLVDVEAALRDASLLQPTVSLSGATAGSATYTPVVAPPAGVEVLGVSAVTVVLGAGPG